MAKKFVHRDQVHGDTRLDPLSVALLNTPVLQRLGRIYQLGYAHIVYRGGTHTRLSHVLGTTHMAGKIVDQLRQNYAPNAYRPEGAIEPVQFLPAPDIPDPNLRWDVLRNLVVWAALLHDIGHVPLGHTLEDEFKGLYEKHDSFKSPRLDYLWCNSGIREIFLNESLYQEPIHQYVDLEIIYESVMITCLYKQEPSRTFGEIVGSTEAESGGMLSQSLSRSYQNVVKAGWFAPYMTDIVSDTICADYLDYLQRDPTNVGLDTLKDDRVVSAFYIGCAPVHGENKDDGGNESQRYRMGLALHDHSGKPRHDVATGVVELVRQRYRFAEIIYYHKTKIAASAMLAKVFSYLGFPDEIPMDPPILKLENISNRANSLIEHSAIDTQSFVHSLFPTALLDTSVGDESLMLVLLRKAQIQLESLVSSPTDSGQSVAKVSQVLLGICLLQHLVRRDLYKVACSISSRDYSDLHQGSSQGSAVEDHIKKTLHDLRDNIETRSQLESDLASSAGLPDGSLILYVPPRKSQAKGIETGAFDHGEVIQLGTHEVVRDEVDELGRKYERLWRILLLVHPDFRREDLKLTKAVYHLVTHIWRDKKDREFPDSVLKQICWFDYIPQNHYASAETYKNLRSISDIQDEEISWSRFLIIPQQTLSANSSADSDEYAYRMLLVDLLNDDRLVATISVAYSTPGSLSDAIKERGGIADDAATVLRALNEIATTLRGEFYFD